jgi:hypothetical protein
MKMNALRLICAFFGAVACGSSSTGGVPVLPDAGGSVANTGIPIGCTEQPPQLADQYCRSAAADSLVVCDKSMPTPSGCTVTVQPNSYCCPKPVLARAIVEAQMVSVLPARCPAVGAFLTIGSFQSPPEAVLDGAPFKGAVARVKCSVVANGGDFSVSATVSRAGQGTLSFVSTRVAPAIASALRTSVSGGGLVEEANQDDCVFTPFHPGGKYEVTVSGQTMSVPDIAPGRLWGTVKCSNPTGNSGPSGCGTTATIRLENCAAQ